MINDNVNINVLDYWGITYSYS